MVKKKSKAKKPVVIFCELRRPADEIINISSQNGAEGVVTRMLPKSHVSHVILNANVSEDRFLDMKVSTESKMQKKSLDVHDHFINTFVKRLKKKEERWRKEDEYVSKNLQLSNLRRNKTAEKKPVIGIGAFSLPTPLDVPATYKKANYPYANVNRAPKPDTSQGRTTSVLPRIQTVPAGKPRLHPSPPKQVRLPEANNVPNDDPFNYRAPRADSASTVATRLTGNGRKRAKSMRNYDNRFTELMTFLSPVNAMNGPMSRRRKLGLGFQGKTAMFGMDLSSV